MRAVALVLSGACLFGCKTEAPPGPSEAAPSAVASISIEELGKRVSTDRAATIGKRFRVQAHAKSIGLDPKGFDPAKGIVGAVPEEAPGAVYPIPLETGGGDTVCWVDRTQQQKLLGDFSAGVSVTMVVEGTVEPAFGQLAPCTVVDKKIERK